MNPPPPTPPSFERSPMPGVELDELSMEQLALFVQRRVPALVAEVPLERLATGLGLLGGSLGRPVPTVAGLLLFGHLPQMARPEWGVAAVRIRGTEICGEILARAELEGPLPRLIDQGLAFVEAHACALRSDGHPTSGSEFPAVVVREALVNALAHRDYRLTGRVALRVFDDRLEVWSPGGMPVQAAPDQLALRGGISFPRNPLLVSALRLLGFMDQIGRGLTLIRTTLAELTSAPLAFRTTQADFLIVLPSPLGALPLERNGN